MVGGGARKAVFVKKRNRQGEGVALTFGKNYRGHTG